MSHGSFFADSDTRAGTPSLVPLVGMHHDKGGVMLNLCMQRAELAVSWSTCGARTRARHKFFSMLVRSFWVATDEHHCVSERACLHSGERAV